MIYILAAIGGCTIGFVLALSYGALFNWFMDRLERS